MKKKVSDIPDPSCDVTNQTLPGREYFNNSWPSRVWLVTSQLGTGKSLTFFYSVGISYSSPYDVVGKNGAKPILLEKKNISTTYLLTVNTAVQKYLILVFKKV
jgi:hypothetical protein